MAKLLHTSSPAWSWARPYSDGAVLGAADTGIAGDHEHFGKIR